MTEFEELVAEIELRRNTRIESSRRISRATCPRASSIDDCARRNYHDIVDWPLAPQASVQLLQRFRRGDEVEKLVKRELLEDGWEIVEGQMPFEYREHIPELGRKIVILTGHCDGRIAKGSLRPVFEIKSVNVNVFNRIETVQDFRKMASFWAKYPRQILIYCFAYDEPYGLFILDDCLGHWKILPVVLEDNLDYCEEALQIARAAAVAVELGEPPPFHQDPTVCQECWCRSAGICQPPLDFSDGALKLIENGELAESLDVMYAVRDEAEDYLKRKTAMKRIMKPLGNGKYVIGDHCVDVTTKSNGVYVSWTPLLGEPEEATP